jgi:hypothetical protein
MSARRMTLGELVQKATARVTAAGGRAADAFALPLAMSDGAPVADVSLTGSLADIERGSGALLLSDEDD